VVLAAAAGLTLASASHAQESTDDPADAGVPTDAGVPAGDTWPSDGQGDRGSGRRDAAPGEIDGRSGAAEDGATEAGRQAKPADLPHVDPAYEVIVRARRPIARDRTRDDVKVDGQRLRDSPRASTLEALSQESAGVYVPGRGSFHGVASGATGGITIRGLGGSPNSQVLVVEDGAPDYMGIFGHPIPDAYVPFLIEDALVIKGGDSVLYGTNAMGGVVVLRSRWRETEGFEIFNDAGYGSYSTMRETASVLGRAGDLDLAAAVHALSSQGHRDGAGGDEIVGHLAARYRFTPTLRLSVRDKVVHLAGADPGPVTHPHIDHWYDVWRNNASMQLEWGRRPLRLTVTPFFNMGVHRLYDGFLSHDVVGGGIAEADLRLHRTTRLLVGLGGQRVDGEVENRIDSERTSVRGLTDLSAYGQLALQLFRQLSIVAGTRVLYSITYGPVLLYKGGIRWSIHRGFYAHTRIARNFRQPTIRELYLPFPTANPDLRPEYSLNWDFGLGYETEKLEISCSGYRTQADDMIRYFGAWPTAEVVNIGHIVIWGVEGRIGLRRLGPISIFVSGDWRDVGRYTRQNPRAKLDFTLEASHELGSHFVGGSLTGEWVNGLYMANYARRPLEDAFAIDLALRYRYTSGDRKMSLEPYLFLRNFLDRRYAFVEGYPMPGFNVLVGLRVGL
jgi:iron complex outermembrane receptor protein